MDAVLDSCAQELDHTQVPAWLDEYFRERHGLEIDQGAAAFWELLAQSRKVVRGSLNPSDGHITPALAPMINHTLITRTAKTRTVNWTGCLADQTIGEYDDRGPALPLPDEHSSPAGVQPDT